MSFGSKKNSTFEPGLRVVQNGCSHHSFHKKINLSCQTSVAADLRLSSFQTDSHACSCFYFVFSILADYMVWDVIRSDIKWLSEPFRKANLKYLNETTGATSVQEHWKTCIEQVEENFYNLIAAAYVNEFHTQFTKPISKVSS